jgi:xanthosine utilization system XapX-like protein
MKDVILDRAATASPSVGYLGVWLAGVPIQTVVAIMTGVLVGLQIYKAVTDILAQRKAAQNATTKPTG